MIRVGIIGGIGSGKSFVAKLFKLPVFNADKEVKLIYNYNKKCFHKLKKKIPDFIKTFPVKKTELIKAINADKRNLKKISSIVHPIVRQKLEIFLKKNNACKMLILDIPLLLENKLNKKKDVLIFVKSKKGKVLSRLKKRKNYNKEILKKLKKNQEMMLIKLKMADYVIDNNFSQNIMQKKINLLKKKILNERNNT